MAKGTKRERTKGVWELRAYVGRDPITKKPIQVSRTVRCGSRAADAALRALVTEVEGGAHKGSKGTLATLLPAWLADAEHRKKPNTILAYRVFSKRATAAIGEIRLDKLGTVEIDAWYNAMMDEGLSPGTIRAFHNNLSGALEQAVTWGWITTNPARRARPPRPLHTEVKPPTTVDVQRIIAEAEKVDPLMAKAIVLLALTGMRRGEACGLRWSDVDLDGGTLQVQRNVSRGLTGGTLEVGAPKNRASRRRVPLHELAVGVLRAHRAECTALALATDVTRDPDPYVLADLPDGSEPLNPDRLTAFVTELRKGLGMPTLRLHDLRHFLASVLIDDGVNVKQVAAMLGHAKTSVTLDTYSHLFSTNEKDAEVARIAAGFLTS